MFYTDITTAQSTFTLCMNTCGCWRHPRCARFWSEHVFHLFKFFLSRLKSPFFHKFIRQIMCKLLPFRPLQKKFIRIISFIFNCFQALLQLFLLGCVHKEMVQFSWINGIKCHSITTWTRIRWWEVFRSITFFLMNNWI